MTVLFWSILVFVVGLVVGSFLNVAIARLPFQKSLVWPGSRCGNCYQRIRWHDNLPLLSYLWLGGRCRTCGATFSSRYLFVELLTGLGFVGLFHLEIVRNVHFWPVPFQFAQAFHQGVFPNWFWIGFSWHALLFCFLMTAAMCDLNGREIPLALTLTGTLVGLIGSAYFPWPYPHNTLDALPRISPIMDPQQAWMFDRLPQGLYPWPVWGPLPDWLPVGSWQLGLATGAAGALVGTFLLRAIGFLFSTGLGKEALGLGDADLMMMVGAFLGWQPVVVAFFVSVLPALFIGLFQLAVHRDNSMPFGPSLAIGTLITFLSWSWLGPYVQVLFFNTTLMAAVLGAGAVFILLSSFLMSFARGRGTDPASGGR